MPKILREKIILDNTLEVQEAEIENNGKTFERVRVNREDGAAVLVFNTESKKIILTKQFRYAVSSREKEDILEILAGKVDKGYSAIDTAVKETKEEIGYEVKAEDMTSICSCYVSPGYTSELLHLYYCEVTNAQKVNKGGGLPSENEDIHIIEMDAAEFLSKVNAGGMRDSKTILAALWLQNQVLLAQQKT